MATRTKRFMSAALSAARQAQKWATVAAREADQLMHEARKEADSRDRRMRLKRTLLRTARVLKAVGKAAAIAGLAAAIAASRVEQKDPKLSKGKRDD
jgi:hypothetical protein